MSKPLSNSLLSMRFMQNAQRAKQQAQVEAEQAKIKDEAEWSVPQAWRDAWGIGSNSTPSSSTITHEASYIPFLFSSSADDLSEPSSSTGSGSMPKLKGRRTFNARGHEVISDATKSAIEVGEIADVEMEDVTKPTRRPMTISGFPKPSKKEGKERETGATKRKPQVKTISGFQAPAITKTTKETKRTKTAQMLIREDNGKGLRAPPPLQTYGETDSKMDVDPPTGFLKPAGVDAPAGLSNSALKRTRDTVDPASQEEKRPKKKKKKTATS